MQQIGRPERVGRGPRDGVSQTADGIEPAALLEREVADDRLLSRVGAAPVTCPAWIYEKKKKLELEGRWVREGGSWPREGFLTFLCSAVFVWVVAAERHVAPRGGRDSGEDAQGNNRGRIDAKVFLHKGGGAAVLEEVVPRVGGELDGFHKGAGELAVEGDVAGLVDGEKGCGGWKHCRGCARSGGGSRILSRG